MSGRVFVVQRPVFRDRGTGLWTDKYDLSPAGRFGELVECLPVGNIPSDVGDATALLRERLAGYRDGDHLLAIGDPVAIAIAVLVAAGENGGRVSILKWDRRSLEYRAHAVCAGGTTASRRPLGDADMP